MGRSPTCDVGNTTVLTPIPNEDPSVKRAKEEAVVKGKEDTALNYNNCLQIAVTTSNAKSNRVSFATANKKEATRSRTAQ